MAGLLTNGFNQLSAWTGSEQLPLDTELPSGEQPQQAMTNAQELAIALKFYGATLDKSTVAGTRYYRSIVLGNNETLTGISVLIGSTGGTDKWIFELHDSTGALVATTSLSGVTTGTANTWQQIPFTASYAAGAGTYYIAVQSNGTTAKIATIDAPTSPLVTGSASGTFGTSASITPPTTYTANDGPVSLVY